ncbi:putative mitochondrial protein, partial [Mucuna pruriens]
MTILLYLLLYIKSLRLNLNVEGMEGSCTLPQAPTRRVRKGEKQKSKERECILQRPLRRGKGHIASQCPNKRTMILRDDSDIDSESSQEKVLTLGSERYSSEEVSYEGDLLMASWKCCSLIIDGSSSVNVASLRLVENFICLLFPILNPISFNGSVNVELTSGKYKDKILCDVVPIKAKMFDRKVIHDGVTNKFSFIYKGSKIDKEKKGIEREKKSKSEKIKDKKDKSENILHDVMHSLPMHRHINNKAILVSYVPGSQGVKTTRKKVKVIQGWPTPKSMINFKSFHGITRFYRYFVKKFSILVVPLNKIMKNNKKWVEFFKERHQVVQFGVNF